MIGETDNQLINIDGILERAQVRAGMHIADFGCSRTGHVVFRAAPIVGERGMVYAVDILKDALEEVGKRARLENLHMVHPVWADMERVGKTAIPEKSLDCIFMINVLAEVKEKEAALTEAARLLKEKARLVVVDWQSSPLLKAFHRKQAMDFGPITRWCEAHGFVLQEEFLPGKHHNGAVYFRQL